MALEGVPAALRIICNGTSGLYIPARRAVQCMCGTCVRMRHDPRCAEWLVSPTEFERHAGMPSAKKWRYRWAGWGLVGLVGLGCGAGHVG